MLRDFSSQALLMGLLAGFVGFASSFAVVLQGLRGAGADEAQAASGLMAAAIAMGLCAIYLSLRDRNPIGIAWSTPGAALLATTAVPEGGFAEAVGAFLIASALIIVAGMLKPLTRVVSSIPAPLASAMLAGILLSLCLAPFKAIAFDPKLGLPIFITWVIVGQIWPRLAVPAALIAFIAVMILGVDLSADAAKPLSDALIPDPQFIMPEFSLGATLGIALPLFIVTMASQNIPGLAVLTTYGYTLHAGRWFVSTGAFSLMAAPFGGHGINLAAITAAMVAGEEAHPDPSRRYWAAISMGAAYVVLGPFAGLIIAFVTLAPSILIEAVAGLALIPIFVTASNAAFGQEETRIPAAVTFLVTASGLSLAGISGAFWGLLAGLAIFWFKRSSFR